MNIICTTLFGLETFTKEDLASIGYTPDLIHVADGTVTLETTPDNWKIDLARVNMWVRHAERVFFDVGEFDADAFEAFFDNTRALPWNDFIPEGFAFIVNGYSRKSKLYGVPALQSLSKKAIVDSLKASRGITSDTVEEDSDKGTVRITFGIVSDHVRFMIDSSGDGLHKRGYRPLTHEAPIRETLASAMVSIAHYKPFGNESLYDPFCGSGTIVIEAAMKALNIAPGKNRRFAYTSLPYIGGQPLRIALTEARDLEDLSPLDDCYFRGSDIDPSAVRSAAANAKAAGVDGFVRFNVSDFAQITPEKIHDITGFDRNLIITNPPYGGRLMTPEEADRIYRKIASVYLDRDGKCKKGIRLSVISPDDTFERATGFKADKRYKLYNGNIKCQLNNYFKLGKR